MNYWFTSDTHFGHANIIRYCNRPFDSVHDMNKAMTDLWNACVQPDDNIYHLGDFSFGPPRAYLSKLNGNIFLIKGSHDKDLQRLFNAGSQVGKWYWLGPLATISIEGHTVVLCHYAMRRWPKSHYGAWHLYGHSHGKLPGSGYSFDVGVDTHGFQPYSWQEIKERMATATSEDVIRTTQDED